MSDLIRWRRDPLIATSINTTIEALSSNANTVYHYVLDPEFIDNTIKNHLIYNQHFVIHESEQLLGMNRTRN